MSDFNALADKVSRLEWDLKKLARSHRKLLSSYHGLLCFLQEEKSVGADNPREQFEIFCTRFDEWQEMQSQEEALKERFTTWRKGSGA